MLGLQIFTRGSLPLAARAWQSEGIRGPDVAQFSRSTHGVR